MGNICPMGKYCEDGSVTGVDCPAGTFSDRLGLTVGSECDLCTPGSYCATTGLIAVTGDCYVGENNTYLPLLQYTIMVLTVASYLALVFISF